MSSQGIIVLDLISRQKTYLYGGISVDPSSWFEFWFPSNPTVYQQKHINIIFDFLHIGYIWYSFLVFIN